MTTNKQIDLKRHGIRIDGARAIRTTLKATLFEINGKQVWIPNSQGDAYTPPERAKWKYDDGDVVVLYVTKWFAGMANLC